MFSFNIFDFDNNLFDFNNSIDRRNNKCNMNNIRKINIQNKDEILDTYKNIPNIKGIKRFGPLCYLISAIQSLRYLDLKDFDLNYKKIISKIREGDLRFILNYFEFPMVMSSARDAIYKICNKCNIEITEYFDGFEFDSKNIIILIHGRLACNERVICWIFLFCSI